MAQQLEEGFLGYIVRSPEADKLSRETAQYSIVSFFQSLPQVIFFKLLIILSFEGIKVLSNIFIMVSVREL